MTALPEISVIMGVYNGSRYLSPAIESILNQSFGNFEFIIVNDGSTDETADILDSFSRQDARIKIITNSQNIGLTKSLNIAIEHARGRFIARQDADDMSLRDRLEKQHSIACQTGADIIGSQAYSYVGNKFKVSPRTEFIENITFEKLKFGNIFVHGTLFFKSEVLKNNMYDPEIRYSQDYELMLRLLKSGKLPYVIKEVLYFQRVTGGSTSRAMKQQQLEYTLRICRKYFGTTFFFMEKNFLLKSLLMSLRKLIGN
jgi:glycosyltransferase involved in cell wall biosynthesis